MSHTTRSFIVLSMIIFSQNLFSQDIGGHSWKNRLLILVTDSPDNTDLVTQVEIFQDEIYGLDERKLLIYQLNPGSKRTGLDLSKEWLPDPDDRYRNFQRGDNKFELILIGLDGGIKSRWTEPVKCEEIFGLIDGMPMRRAELRNQNK